MAGIDDTEQSTEKHYHQHQINNSKWGVFDDSITFCDEVTILYATKKGCWRARAGNPDLSERGFDSTFGRRTIGGIVQETD